MDFAHILVGVLLAAVAIVLLMGVGLMMKGGDMNRKYGNKLMVARVTLQGLTILVIGILFLFSKH